MRTGNPIDGMYFIFIIIPFVLSLWIGDLVRKKIVNHFTLDSIWSQNLSIFVGVLTEILIIMTGISFGLLLIMLG